MGLVQFPDFKHAFTLQPLFRINSREIGLHADPSSGLDFI